MFSFASSVIFIAFATVWKTDDWINATIKIVLILMAIWAVLTAMSDWGVVVMEGGAS